MGSDATVADAMIRAPKLLPGEATVRDVREAFADDHVHAVLLVEASQLVAVIERTDLPGHADHVPARRAGRLAGRTIGPRAALAPTRRYLVRHRLRRLAVTEPDGTLLGLLCLKASGTGFCSDADVRDRAADGTCARAAAR